jgi:hypothetical protein
MTAFLLRARFNLRGDMDVIYIRILGQVRTGGAPAFSLALAGQPWAL